MILVIPHEHATYYGNILMQENWCASAANLRNCYMAANSYPLSCTKKFKKRKKKVYSGKDENSLFGEGRKHTSDNTVIFIGTKQISAPTVKCTNTFIYMYRYSNNEDLSTALKLSLATVTPSHAEHGGPSCCVCKMAVYLMDSDCRHMVSQ